MNEFLPNEKDRAALTDWYADGSLAQQSSALLEAGVRVPQEALTLTALRSGP
jgi:hypothetical protein